MIKLSLIGLAACASSMQAPAPASPPVPEARLDPALAALRPLIGSWQGTDPDHHSSGAFTLEPDLGGKILLRRSTNDTAQGHHEDVMIVFASPLGLRASYFDNEGHVIEYAITATNDHVELLSDDVANQPRFKLAYDLHGADELAIDFAIKPPGTPDFQHYVGGVVHRVAR